MIRHGRVLRSRRKRKRRGLPFALGSCLSAAHSTGPLGGVEAAQSASRRMAVF